MGKNHIFKHFNLRPFSNITTGMTHWKGMVHRELVIIGRKMSRRQLLLVFCVCLTLHLTPRNALAKSVGSVASDASNYRIIEDLCNQIYDCTGPLSPKIRKSWNTYFMVFLQTLFISKDPVANVACFGRIPSSIIHRPILMNDLVYT